MKPATEATLRALRMVGEQGMTDLEAVRWVGTSRLAARVWELRQAGYDVRDRWVTTEAGARIKRYFIDEGVAA